MRLNLHLASVVALLFTVISLTACGEKGARVNEHAASEGDPAITYPNPGQILYAQSAHLLCSIQGECDPSVVMITVATGAGIERCSGFLVSPTEVLTNDHCLSHTYAKYGQCSGFTFIHFAGVHQDGLNLEEHTAQCESVQFRSQEKGISSADYAILKLDHPVENRTPLTLAQTGFASNEEAVIHRVQMQGNNSRGESLGMQTFVRCKAIHHSIIFPNVDENSTLMTFGDCLIQEGNSGSPVLNSRGEVGAILQGYANQDGRDVAGTRTFQALALDAQFNAPVVATQTKCMSAIFPNAPQCMSSGYSRMTYPESFLAQFPFPNPLLPRAEEGLHWKLASETSQPQAKAIRRFVQVPKCFAGSHSSAISEGQLLHAKESLPVMVYTRGLDENFRAEWRSLYREGEAVAPFQVRARNVNGGVPQSYQYSSSELGSVVVPACGPAFR